MFRGLGVGICAFEFRGLRFLVWSEEVSESWSGSRDVIRFLGWSSDYIVGSAPVNRFMSSVLSLSLSLSLSWYFFLSTAVAGVWLMLARIQRGRRKHLEVHG